MTNEERRTSQKIINNRRPGRNAKVRGKRLACAWTPAGDVLGEKGGSKVEVIHLVLDPAGMRMSLVWIPRSSPLDAKGKGAIM